MKRIKVFARKLSLMLMALILALVMIPSNFVFAEETQELVWEELEPIELIHKKNIGGHCPPRTKDYNEVNVRKITEKNESGVFRFRIKAYRGDLEESCSYYLADGLEEVEENVYEFSLRNGQSQKFYCPDDYFKYQIYEVKEDNWELVDINGEQGVEIATGGMEWDKFTYEAVFRNRKIAGDDNSSGELASDSQVLDPATIDSAFAAPNTGESTSSFSATRTGIIAFSIIATFGRVVYLIRKNKG